MRTTIGWLSRGGFVLGVTTAAGAHVPYVLPSVFDAGSRDRISIVASFTEDAFRPEIAMQDAPFEITGPDGRTLPLPVPMLTRELTLVEAALPVDGLYRLSSGQRLGRMGKMYRQGSGWPMVGEGAVAAAGATLVDVRSATLADAYVLRGKAGSVGAPAPRGKALEIVPGSDPASFAPTTPIRFTILYDGKPLAGETATLMREAGFYDGRKDIAAGVTDAAGTVSITVPDAGRCLLLVRHRPVASAAGDLYTSYTATLAFEAM